MQAAAKENKNQFISKKGGNIFLLWTPIHPYMCSNINKPDTTYYVSMNLKQQSDIVENTFLRHF